jgi:hypothetical protein
MPQQHIITLPADVYDALELSAIAYGGIGEGTFGDWKDGNGTGPRCIVGHAWCLREGQPAHAGSAVSQALSAAGIDVSFNDRLVKRALDEGAGIGDDRISWDEYVKRGNIVRGAETEETNS